MCPTLTVLRGSVGGGLASSSPVVAVGEAALDDARLAELPSESAASPPAPKLGEFVSRCLACFHEEEVTSSVDLAVATSNARDLSRGRWWWWWWWCRLGLPFCFGGSGGGKSTLDPGVASC